MNGRKRPGTDRRLPLAAFGFAIVLLLVLYVNLPISSGNDPMAGWLPANEIVMAELERGLGEEADDEERSADEIPIVDDLRAAVDEPDGTPGLKWLSINSATDDELQSLPGIGPVKAKAIVEYREKEGKFTKVEDLMKVKGIGPKTFERLKPFISVD